MRNIEELKTTTNRSVFNRAYKKYLESTKGEIHCSFCKYHRGENKTKYYGGYVDENVNYPNWKLVSKNRKQWMKKPIDIIIDTNNWKKKEYVTIKW